MLFPDGIGLMFYNGARGLYYYASEAGRILVSNGGIIATVLVGSYFFPTQTAVALGGTIASRSSTWLTRQIDQRYHVHLANAHDWLLDQLPISVGQQWFHLTQTLATPQQAISTAVANQQLPPQLYWINDRYVKELIAPVVEEVIFRAGIQEGMGLALTSLGVPSAAAYSLAGLISVTLFAGAHDANPGSQTFRQTLISGITFGLMMHFYGLPAAVTTHALNNFTIRFVREL